MWINLFYSAQLKHILTPEILRPLSGQFNKELQIPK